MGPRPGTDSDAHKALEGACHSLCLHDDPALQERVDDILDQIVAAQQNDGYLVSFIPQVGGLIYATRGNRIHANLYAAGEAQVTLAGGAILGLTQETDYPWDGRVRLTIDPQTPSAIDLRLRIPGWARGRPIPGDLYRYASPEAAAISLTLNGEPVEATPGEDGYVRLERTWKSGDVVELNLPMPVRRVYSHEKIEGDAGRVALMRGPVVYCFEGIDNDGLDLFKLSLPGDSELTAVHRPELLDGMTVVHGTGLDAQDHSAKLTAIPYFSWANRGKTPMNLWIQEAKAESAD